MRQMAAIRHTCRDGPIAHSNNKDMSPYASTKFFDTLELFHIHAMLSWRGIGVMQCKADYSCRVLY
jgi:hypothetical protein